MRPSQAILLSKPKNKPLGSRRLQKTTKCLKSVNPKPHDMKHAKMCRTLARTVITKKNTIPSTMNITITVRSTTTMELNTQSHHGRTRATTQTDLKSHQGKVRSTMLRTSRDNPITNTRRLTQIILIRLMD